MLPAPFIRLYDKDGNFISTRSYPCQPAQQLQSLASEELSPNSSGESCSTNSQGLPQTTPKHLGGSLSDSETTITSTNTNALPCAEMSSATLAPNGTLNTDCDYTPLNSKNLQRINLFSENDVLSDQFRRT